MASPIFFLPLFFLICSTLMPSKSHFINPINGGFTMSLVHRDSPHSPFYNHSMNLYERRVASAKRSISRLKHLSLRAKATSQSNSLDISPKLIPDNLEYIVSYYIGTPGSKVDAFIDTASDIIWTKALPIFDPSTSSSYANLSCISQTCLNLGAIRTCPSYADETCTYDMVYADGAMSNGILANDKFLFDSSNGPKVDVGFVNFGYNNESSPHFKGKQNGCLALSRGNFSLISQLGIRKFSHCFVTPDNEGSGSRMYFGSKAVIYASDLTPLLESKDSFYYVKLEGISIGDTGVEIPHRALFGGVIVDAGSSNTMLASAVYDPLLTTIRGFIQKPLVKDPNNEFELCFGGTYDDLAHIPLVTFHFTAVDLKLTHDVTFVEYGKGIWCLAILRSYDLQSVIGNIQMRNLWVGYDLDRNGISFSRADCPTF